MCVLCIVVCPFVLLLLTIVLSVLLLLAIVLYVLLLLTIVLSVLLLLAIVLSVLLLLAIVLSVLFLLAIVLSVLLLLANVLSILLRYTDSDFPFGIFKLFFILNLNGTGKIYILNRSLRLIISFSFCSNLFLLSIQYTQSLRYIDTLITCKTYHSY